MKTNFPFQKERGLTLLEIFVILAVISVLALLLLPALRLAKERAQRVSCVNNLMGIGLAFRVWAGDNTNLYPMGVSGTNGGTMDFTSGPNAFRHFQVMSNELSTPRVLICPADSARTSATSDTNFNLRNSNLSYFVGIDASETNPQLILSGDRNITNGTPTKNGVLEVATNIPAAFTAELHNGTGNITLSDGSVQPVSSTGLRITIANTSLATNRLQMPVLGP